MSLEPQYTMDLLEACRNGDLDGVQRALSEGANVNAKGDDEKTPLHFAIEALEATLKDASRINPPNEEHKLSLKGIISLLLQHGANVNVPVPSSGQTPLHMVCRIGDEGIVRLFLQNDADIHVRDDNGFTPLFHACEKGWYKIIPWLSKMGAEMNMKDCDGRTLLQRVCLVYDKDERYAWNRDKVIYMMLKYGADANAKCTSGRTLLHYICEGHKVVRRSASIVTLLLAQVGFDINAQTNDGKQWTPLHCAVINGQYAIAGKLLRCGANANARDNSGETPLHLASRLGRLAIASLLLRNGANVNVQDESNNTPLISARENLDVLYLLLRRSGQYPWRP